VISCLFKQVSLLDELSQFGFKQAHPLRRRQASPLSFCGAAD